MLRINPDYEILNEGSSDFTIYYKDSSGNLTCDGNGYEESCFLKATHFDDVNGDGIYGKGDRIQLQFSIVRGNCGCHFNYTHHG